MKELDASTYLIIMLTCLNGNDLYKNSIFKYIF